MKSIRTATQGVIITCLVIISIAGSLYGVPQRKFETGEDMVYKVGNEGIIVPYDVDTRSESFWAIDPVKLTLNSVYLRHLNEYMGGYVAVYATVQPVDDPLSIQKTVYYQELELTGDATLNLTDRILYGPELYDGRPLRLRIAVLQLDPEKYPREIETLRRLNQVPTDERAHYYHNMEAAAAVCENVLHRDKTAVEFYHDLTFHPVVPTGIHGRKNHEVRNLALHPDTYVIMKKEKRFRRDSLFARLTVNWMIELFGRRADGGDVQPASYHLLPLRDTGMDYIAGRVAYTSEPNYESRSNSYVVLTLTKGDEYFLTDLNSHVTRVGKKYMDMLEELEFSPLRTAAIDSASEYLKIQENVMEALQHARCFFKPHNRVNTLIEGLTASTVISRMDEKEKLIAKGTNKELITYLEKTTHLHYRTVDDWIRRHDQIVYDVEAKKWLDTSNAEQTDFIQSLFEGEDMDSLTQP